MLVDHAASGLLEPTPGGTVGVSGTRVCMGETRTRESITRPHHHHHQQQQHTTRTHAHTRARARALAHARAHTHPALLLDDIFSAQKDKFFGRYHLIFGADTEPSGCLVSRLTMLQWYNVTKVKTLSHQLQASGWRRRISDLLEHIEHDTENVMMRLLTRWTAVPASCSLYCWVTVAPTAAEVPETESTDYVAVPLDSGSNYHGHVHHAAAQLPLTDALDWIKRREEEERSISWEHIDTLRRDQL